MEADVFADAMYKAGLLHKKEKGALTVPIHSFEKYLRKHYRSPELRNPEPDSAPPADPAGLAP